MEITCVCIGLNKKNVHKQSGLPYSSGYDSVYFI
jgi:hypothetical protein